jgi:amidohydrolase
MPISPEVEAQRGALVQLRREFHAHPELAYSETRTAARVAQFLAGTGLHVRTGVGGTGLLVSTPTPSATRPRTVLLRVDLDGLPIQELNNVAYASQVPGRMHACGHDGHTAMGAVAARVLGDRALDGTVRLLFQPAEEGEGGAQAVVADGAMQGVDLALGVHLWNELPVGTIGVKPGPLMAAVDRLRIVVHGRGGHGGQPQRSADPIVAAAHLVTALQSIVAREVAPVDAAVVTIGSIHGGEAFNVIPDEVVLTGTIRTFDEALRNSMPERLTRIAQGIAGALQCRAEVEVRQGNPAVINDARVAALATRAAARVVGHENVVVPALTMGGEDMAVYFQQAPGCFVFIGSANPAKGLDHPHHSPYFDFDEDALAVGCEFLVQVAEEALRAD